MRPPDHYTDGYGAAALSLHLLSLAGVDISRLAAGHAKTVVVGSAIAVVTVVGGAWRGLAIMPDRSPLRNCGHRLAFGLSNLAAPRLAAPAQLHPLLVARLRPVAPAKHARFKASLWAWSPVGALHFFVHRLACILVLVRMGTRVECGVGLTSGSLAIAAWATQ